MNMVAVSSPQFISSSPHLLASKIPKPLCVRFRQNRFTAAYTSTGRVLGPPSLHSHEIPSSSSSFCSCSASLYEILGIPIGATCKEIKSAYRKLVRLYHPDVVAIDRKDKSASEFMKIHGAYSTLSDPQKRAEYDQKLFSRLSSQYATSAYGLSSSMSGFSGYIRRTWETDQCW